MPKASIVVPCYNAERFVEETIASAQAQTIQDIEIICVDDGSSDATLAILRQLAAADERIRVIEQQNGGEGPARDAGLVAATGDWLYFLDADDIMLPTLLEEAIACGDREHADVVVFRTNMLNDQTGEQVLCEWSFKRDWLDGNTFAPRDYPEHVFTSFQNWVHNKLFRTSFVREHGLHMQHVHRTADLLFTCRALFEAEKIALIDAPLHVYRVNNAQSAMATSDLYPLDFYYAFAALREALEDAGVWELYHDSFVNWAIDGIAYNLSVARSYDSYRTVVRTLQEEGFERLDITGFPREKSNALVRYDQVRPLVEGDSAESLFALSRMYKTDFENAETAASFERVRRRRVEEQLEQATEENASMEEAIAATEAELSEAHAECGKRDKRIQKLETDFAELRHAFDCVTGSLSFKIGRAVTFVPRAVVGLLRRKG